MSPFIRLGLIVGMIAAIEVCDQHARAQPTVPTPKDHARQIPTASEIFNLKADCVEISNKLMERKRAENDLIMKAFEISQKKPRFWWDVQSHYSFERGTCYAKMYEGRILNADNDTRFRNVSVRPISDEAYSLYDARTGELLAAYRYDMQNPRDRAKRWAYATLAGYETDFATVVALIDQLMHAP